MCGIAGVVRLDGRSADPVALARMSDALGHRGPDGAGVFLDGPVGLAHRRLAIIDPAGSPQPMAASGGALHVSFNGEILNYRELRGQLTYPYRTGGDTEVLLALYTAEGPTGADKLIGQFAYAMYDSATTTVTLVRDAMGILPLYCYRAPDAVWFASEVKAIIAGLGSAPPVDTGQLSAYLQHRFVPAPYTLFEGIRKVPAGHWINIGEAGLGPATCFVTEPTTTVALSDTAALQSLDVALHSAVQRSLVADVPVGAFLSGGLDSSLLTSLAVEARPDDRLLTFSAGFTDERWDELPHARRVAAHLGTEHHEIVVQPNDFEQLLAPLTWFRDAPISEPSDIPMHLLARLAHEQVKVALSGEGADELFGGYPKYRLAAITQRVGAVPRSVRAGAGAVLERHLPPDRWRMRTAVRALSADSEERRYDTWFSSFTSDEACALLHQQPPRDPSLSVVGTPAIRRMMDRDVAAWLPDNLLERADRMAMATSLEVRPPFLDPAVVELSRRLSPRQLVRGQTTKWLLKEYARAKLPEGIADRAKLGFRVPIGDWFRTHLRDEVRGRLLDSASFTRQVFDGALVETLLNRHDSGAADEGSRVWTLLALEVWHETFYRGGARAALPSG